MIELPDYPRTLHLGDSGGRRSRHHCPFAELAGRHLVIEEKVDGSHCGLLFDDQAELHALVGPSRYKSDEWRERCPDLAEVEDSDAMEGLYIKVEGEDFVEGRFKWIRPGFLDHIEAAAGHWRERPQLYNLVLD